MEINRNSFTPSTELQQQVEAFQAARQAYIETQDVYLATVEETRRLERTAEALEAEAEEANASWKAMAKARHADQRKINAEVERAVQRKMDGEKFRRTASVREELHGEIVVQMAKARAAVQGACRAVRSRYTSERVQALLATEGLAELLGELRALLDHAAAAEGHGSLMAELKTSDFGQLVALTASKADSDTPAIFIETAVPHAVAGEVRSGGGIELAALEMSNGQTTNIIEARRIVAAN
jgi:hypothetical protein